MCCWPRFNIWALVWPSLGREAAVLKQKMLAGSQKGGKRVQAKPRKQTAADRHCEQLRKIGRKSWLTHAFLFPDPDACEGPKQHTWHGGGRKNILQIAMCTMHALVLCQSQFVIAHVNSENFLLLFCDRPKTFTKRVFAALPLMLNICF